MTTKAAYRSIKVRSKSGSLCGDDDNNSTTVALLHVRMCYKIMHKKMS